MVGTNSPDPDVLPPRIGGMAGAIVTSPFDVVKTRLQSSLFRESHLAVNVVANGMNGGVLTMPQGRSGLLRHFVETTHIIRCVERMSLTARNSRTNSA
jgi:solute carrier family 25, member 33/36